MTKLAKYRPAESLMTVTLEGLDGSSALATDSGVASRRPDLQWFA